MAKKNDYSDIKEGEKVETTFSSTTSFSGVLKFESSLKVEGKFKGKIILHRVNKQNRRIF